MREYAVTFRHLGFLYEVEATYDTSGPNGCVIEIEEILRCGKVIDGADFDGFANEIDPAWSEKLGEQLAKASWEV